MPGCRSGAGEIKLGIQPQSTESQWSVAVHLSSESAHRRYLASDSVCLICLYMTRLGEKSHLSEEVVSLKPIRPEQLHILVG